MANEYGYETIFKVYEIVRAAKVRDFKDAYGLLYVTSFGNREEADTWIKENGERQTDYTILEVTRNK